jgi:hypothetical protein
MTQCKNHLHVKINMTESEEAVRLHEGLTVGLGLKQQSYRNTGWCIKNMSVKGPGSETVGKEAKLC